MTTFLIEVPFAHIQANLAPLKELLCSFDVPMGSDRNFRLKKVSKYFNDYFKKGKITEGQIENLILSVLAGRERIKWSHMEGIYDSDVYYNAQIVFESYVKQIKDNIGSYERCCKFIQLLVEKVTAYGKKYHIFSGALGQFEQEMFCDFLHSMICFMNLTNVRKLYLLTWMCELMNTNFDLQWPYREFIVKIYCSVFPNFFDKKQKERMLENFNAFWE